MIFEDTHRSDSKRSLRVVVFSKRIPEILVHLCVSGYLQVIQKVYSQYLHCIFIEPMRLLQNEHAPLRLTISEELGGEGVVSMFEGKMFLLFVNLNPGRVYLESTLKPPVNFYLLCYK